MQTDSGFEQSSNLTYGFKNGILQRISSVTSLFNESKHANIKF